MTAPIIPYSRQDIDETDIAAVTEALRSAWLTTGPKVGEFERAFAAAVDAGEAVAVSSGTAALHAAVHCLDLQPGDQVIVPPITFVASANAVVYSGGTPVFADVEADSGLLDPAAAAAAITERTRAVLAVDYAGQPCRYRELRELCRHRGLTLIADACHSLGGRDESGAAVGALADLNAFSFHPVKPMTTAEGGMITTEKPEWARRMRIFRNHGISTDFREREQAATWRYALEELGYNYRLSDLQCALGLSQLSRLEGWAEKRRQLAARYDEAFHGDPLIQPMVTRPGVRHAYHLYVVRIGEGRRDEVFRSLRRRGIAANVHYFPVHLQPFYQRAFGTASGLCPQAEGLSREILSIPLFPALRPSEQELVITSLREAVAEAART